MRCSNYFSDRFPPQFPKMPPVSVAFVVAWHGEREGAKKKMCVSQNGQTNIDVENL